VIDNRDAIAQLVGFVHVVRRDENREIPFGLDLAEHLPHRDTRYRIEPGGRLVEKEDARLVHESARDFNAAPHSAGEILHLRIAPLREFDRLKQLVDQLHPRGARHTIQLREDDQVLLDAQLEIAGHRLRDDANRSPHAVGLFDHIEAVDERGPRRRRQQRHQHPDERRLAGAVRSQKSEDLPFLNGEADAVDGGELAELLDDLLNVYRNHVVQAALKGCATSDTALRTS
jgi:hypothetical protein